jgi:hypothetical protein
MSDTNATAWQHTLETAQHDRSVTYKGVDYLRVPYTQETVWGEEFQQRQDPCRDCATSPGQLHVTTCCMEECPVCHENQRISCDHWWALNPHRSWASSI